MIVNGSFITLPLEAIVDEKPYTANLNRIIGWATVNTSKTYSGDGKKLIESNQCQFFYSKRKQEKYTYNIMGWTYPICLLMDSLQRDCTYELFITYKWSSSTYKKRSFGVAAITRTQFENLLEIGADNILPDFHFTANKKSKLSWTTESAMYKARGGEEYLIFCLVDKKKAVINPGTMMFSNVSLIQNSECKSISKCSITEEITPLPTNAGLGFSYESNCFTPSTRDWNQILTEFVRNKFKKPDSTIIISSYWNGIGSFEQQEATAQRRAQFIRKYCDTILPNEKRIYDIRIQREVQPNQIHYLIVE